jgi:signal transduction histidine kinase
MRLRIVAVVVATTSLVLVSFLLPFALVLRTLAADHATSNAMVEAQSVAALVTAMSDRELRLAVAQVNAASNASVTVFLPDGAQAGIPVPKSPGALLALREKRSFSSSVPGGVEVLVAVGGLSGGTAVIRSFVPEAVLRHGVTRAWLLLLGIGAFLLLLSVAVADQLARSLVRPLTGVALAADHLATGDLSARATVTGPLEVRRVANGLNRLAARIDDLLAHERESAADLSHRLRTPLTALRIDAESLQDERLLDDVAAVERTVSDIIQQTRRQRGGLPPGIPCDAAAVVTERAAFWRPLAEDQDRHMSVEVPAEPVIVQASREDLAACADVLLENVFTHTPEGVSFAIRLSRRASGGAWLVVADDGPGFPPGSPVRRGQSGGGSTGLGLDIARRVAEASGETMPVGRSAAGGGCVSLGLGPPAGLLARRRHRRAGLRAIEPGTRR